VFNLRGGLVMKTDDWLLPDEKDLAVYYQHLLKQGFIKKKAPLKDVIQLYCKLCCSTIYSRYSGEYVTCKCGSIAIDQTHEYTRLIGNECDYEIKQEEMK